MTVGPVLDNPREFYINYEVTSSWLGEVSDLEQVLI